MRNLRPRSCFRPPPVVYLPRASQLTVFGRAECRVRRGQIPLRGRSPERMVRLAEQTEKLTMAEAGPAAGERALMRAVLEDAIHCLAGDVGPVRERPQLAAEARTWIEGADLHWPYSFENVCDHLGFD